MGVKHLRRRFLRAGATTSFPAACSPDSRKPSEAVRDAHAGAGRGTARVGLRLRSVAAAGGRARHAGGPAPRPPPAVPQAGQEPSPEAARAQRRERGGAAGDREGPRRGDVRPPVLLQLRGLARRRARRRAPHRSRWQHRDRHEAEAAGPRSPEARRERDPRLRPRAGDGEHHRRRGDPARRPGGNGQDLRRRPAAAPRAAAELPDRVFPGGRARLLHDAVVGAARGKARARGRALGARGPGLRAPGRAPGGISHRRRDLDAAVGVRGQGPDDGVQDAALPRPRGDHEGDPRAGVAGHQSRVGEGHEGGAARRVHRDRGSRAHEIGGPGPGCAAHRGDGGGAQREARGVGAARPLRRAHRHQRDDADDRLLARDHRGDAGGRTDLRKGRTHAG